jgi:protein-disulfide isomerase
MKVFFLMMISLASLGWGDMQKVLPQRIVENEYFVGNPDAKAVIYEYGSLTCHVCQDFYKNILPKILEDKDFAGSIRIVIRPFPFNDLDIAGAKMILYSKDPHRLTQIFYEKQEEWIGAKDQLAALKGIAEKSGLISREDIQVSLKDQFIENAMLARRLIFSAHQAAPIFKVGKSILPGLPHWESFSKVLKRYSEYIAQGKPMADFDAMKEFGLLAKEADHDKK